MKTEARAFAPRALAFDVAGTLYACPSLDSRVDEQAEIVLARALRCDLAEAGARLGAQRKENLRLHGDNSKVAALEALGVPRQAFHEAVSALEPGEFLRNAPSLRGFFAELRARGIKIALLSNFRAVLVQKILEELDQSLDCFDASICEDDGFPIKPNVAPFIEIARRLDKAPKDVTFVGDSVSKDLIPAKSIGMSTVLVGDAEDDGVPPAADWKVAEVRDILRLLGPR